MTLTPGRGASPIWRFSSWWRGGLLGLMMALASAGAAHAAPGVTLSTTIVGFGKQLVGIRSATQSLTITNSGDSPLTIHSISLTGAHPGDFLIASDSGQTSLAPGASRMLGIQCRPAAEGARSAALAVSNTAAGSPHTVTLVGTGTVLNAPTELAAQVSPTDTAYPVRLTWNDNSDNEERFELRIQVVGTTEWGVRELAKANSTSVDTGSWQRGRSYRLHVRAVNALGASAWSNEVIVSLIFPPNPPHNLTATGTGAEITLAWTHNNSSTVDLFEVWRKAPETDWVQVGQARAAFLRFTDYGATHGVEYTYRLRTVRKGLVSTWSSEVSASVPDAVLTAPYMLIPVVTAPTRIDLTWKEASTCETGFVLMRKAGTGLYARIAVLPPDTTRYTDTTVSLSTTYTYTLRAINGDAVSAWSTEGSATTPDVLAPTAPTPLTVAGSTANQVHLAWPDRSSNETGFVILRRTGAGSYERIALLPPNTTSYADTTAPPSMSITYIMRAFNSGGVSPWTNELTVATPDGPPLTPATLRAEAVSATRIELYWTDRSSNETGFVLLRRTGTGLYQRIAVLAPDTTVYTDNSVDPNRTYTYIMRAVNDLGVSAWSNEQSAMTPSTLPATPTNMRAVAVSATRVELTWEDNSSNEAEFVLLRRIGTGLYARIAVVGANTTSYADTTVSPGTTYTYIMRAVNESGVSAWSNETNTIQTPSP